MKTWPFISVVILTWNSKEDTQNLLDSIYKSPYPGKREIIVVDNASTDGTIEQIKKRFPKVQLIVNDRNMGMPGLNTGFMKSSGEFIFSIQSDVTVAKDFFMKSVERISSDETIGLMGVKVYEKKTKKLLPPTIKINFFTGDIKAVDTGNAPIPFDYLEGLVHIFPRKILKDVGYINETFYFYGDDPDFSFRIKKAGYKLVYFPHTHVLHGKSISTPTYFRKKYHHYYKALFHLLFSYAHPLQKLIAPLLMLTLIPCMQLILKRRNSFVERWWGFLWNIRFYRYEALFSFAIITGLMLRILHFKTRYVWFDEAFSYFISVLRPIEIVQAIRADTNPPLYYLFLHLSTIQFRHSEFMLRLPSFIFDTLSLIYFFKSVRLIFHRKASYIASALYYLSPLTIYMAVTARVHAAGVFFTVLLTYQLLLLSKKIHMFRLIVFLVTSIAGVYTHYYVSVYLFSLFLITYGVKHTTWYSVRLVIGTALLSLIPWIMYSLLVTRNGCSCVSPLFALPATIVSGVLGGIGEITLRRYLELPSAVLASFLVVLFFFLYHFLKGIVKPKLIQLLFGGSLAILTVAGLLLPVFSPKGASIYNPLFWMIVATGLAHRRFFTYAVAIAALISTNTVIMWHPFFSGLPIKTVLIKIEQQYQLPLVHTSPLTYYSSKFYLKDVHHLLIAPPLYPETVTNLIGGQGYEQPNTELFWLMDTHQWTNEEIRKQNLNYFDILYEKAQTYRYDDLELILYRRK